MQTLKPKKLISVLAFALLGAGYFGAFAAVDLHPLLQNQLALLPVQIGVLIYLLWWRRRGQDEKA